VKEYLLQEGDLRPQNFTGEVYNNRNRYQERQDVDYGHFFLFLNFKREREIFSQFLGWVT